MLCQTEQQLQELIAEAGSAGKYNDVVPLAGVGTDVGRLVEQILAADSGRKSATSILASETIRAKVASSAGMRGL